MIRAALNAQPALDWLAGLPDKAETALLAAAQDLADRLRAIADRNLSGSVLKSRTGTLRASLASGVAMVDGSISVFVTADTPYAAFQEYGFSGVEDVRATVRHQAMAFGRPIKPVDVQVRAHPRRLDYPAHSYLRAALAELTPDIQAGLAQALTESLKP